MPRGLNEEMLEEQFNAMKREILGILQDLRGDVRFGGYANVVQIVSESGLRNGAYRRGVRMLVLHDNGQWGIRAGWSDANKEWIYSYDNPSLDVLLAAYLLTNDALFEQIIGEPLFSSDVGVNVEEMKNLPQDGEPWERCFEQRYARVLQFVKDNRHTIMRKLLYCMSRAIAGIRDSRENPQLFLP